MVHLGTVRPDDNTCQHFSNDNCHRFLVNQPINNKDKREIDTVASKQLSQTKSSKRGRFQSLQVFSDN